VAVLLSVEDEEELERLILANSPKLRAILESARQQIQETGGIQHEDLWRMELSTAPASSPMSAQRIRNK